MKKCVHTINFFVIYAIVSLAFSACDTASNTDDPDLDYFVKYYGGDGDQYGVDMLTLQDGTFLLLGNYAKGTFDVDIYLLRVNSEGDVIWETRFGDTGEIWSAKDMEFTDDGNIVVLADYQSQVGQDIDTKLLKFSFDGVFTDSVGYGTIGNEISKSVTLIYDGGFIVSGTTDSTATFNLLGETDPDLGDIFNVRVDRNLVRFSRNDWGPIRRGYGSNLDVAVKTVVAPTGMFHVYGYTNSTLSGNLNPNERLGLFYFQRDSSGTTGTVWYPGNIINVNDTEINHVEPVDASMGGGHLVVGTSINNVGISEIFVARMRSSLSFQSLSSDATFYNTISLGRNIRGVAGVSSTVGEQGFLLVGNEVRSTGLNLWLTKIDQSGRVLWSTTFGSEAEDDMAAAVTELPDGKVVILGTMGLADNQFKMALIKLNRNGQLLK